VLVSRGQGHEFQDARLYASWGIDFLKYDWCSHGTANSEELIRQCAMRFIVAGRPIVYSICEWGDTNPGSGVKMSVISGYNGDITDCLIVK